MCLILDIRDAQKHPTVHRMGPLSWQTVNRVNKSPLNVPEISVHSLKE